MKSMGIPSGDPVINTLLQDAVFNVETRKRQVAHIKVGALLSQTQWLWINQSPGVTGFGWALGPCAHVLISGTENSSQLITNWHLQPSTKRSNWNENKLLRKWILHHQVCLLHFSLGQDKNKSLLHIWKHTYPSPPNTYPCMNPHTHFQCSMPNIYTLQTTHLRKTIWNSS